MKFGLVFADGPTPADPRLARTLGWEQCEIGRRMDEEHGQFAIYIHAVSLPECVAYVRKRGRDCEFRLFAPGQFLLRVTAERVEG